MTAGRLVCVRCGMDGHVSASCKARVIQACMGGNCGHRDECLNYVGPTTRDEPAERLCAPGKNEIERIAMGSNHAKTMAEFFAKEAHAKCVALTKHERDVMILVSNGLTGKEVARSVGSAVSTVDERRTNALKKLGVTSSIEAAVIMTKAGLL